MARGVYRCFEEWISGEWYPAWSYTIKGLKVRLRCHEGNILEYSGTLRTSKLYSQSLVSVPSGFVSA